jgi:D-xylose 1-dehydrogenase (NADP+, D-xylono-1,5-lactone-forming)
MMNGTQKVRWGVLGAARVSERLLPVIAEAANSEFAAIASRRAGAAEEAVARFTPQAGPQIYDSYEAVLEADDVDAVYLPLNNHEHAEWTVRAIERGKHVLCEKPLALTVSEIEAVEAALAAQPKRLVVMEGFMYRFHPQHARAMEIIRSGLIGEVRQARASFSFMMRESRKYRLAEPTERGGGAMWDVGCYAVSALRMVFESEPESVTAIAKYVETGADVTANGVLDFGDGRRGNFDVGFECARRSEYEVTGTRGGLKCHTVWQLPGDVPVISWWTDDGREHVERLTPANHFKLEIEGFSDSVLNGTEPLISLDSSKGNTRAIVACLRSAAEGKVQRMG